MLLGQKTCEGLVFGQQHQQRDQKRKCQQNFAYGEHPSVDGGIPVGFKRHDPIDEGVTGGQDEDQECRSAGALNAAEQGRITSTIMLIGHAQNSEAEEEPYQEVKDGSSDE